MNLKLVNQHPFLRLATVKWKRRVQKLLFEVKQNPQKYRSLELKVLTIIFIDDVQMAEMNWKYLRHEGPTDLLTFDFKNGIGEIYISLDTTRVQAKDYHQTFEQELTRYLAHGILHLAGFKDKTSLQQRFMRIQEKALMKVIFKKI